MVDVFSWCSNLKFAKIYSIFHWLEFNKQDDIFPEAS